MARGFFITLEGGEGAGKSTQAHGLESRLRELGRTVLRTREPGGSAGAEQIRALLVNGTVDRWSPLTETLLMYAARRDHIERSIAPALKRGEVVVCDRFADSTRAYQGAGGAVDEALIDALEDGVLGPTRPDLTLVLDLPVEIGLARAVARDGGHGRFEARDLAFHQRLRAYFRELAAREPLRCVLIDGANASDVVERAIWLEVSKRLPA